MNRLFWYGFKSFEAALSETRTPFAELAETYRRTQGTTFLHSTARCFNHGDLARFVEAYLPMLDVHDVDSIGLTPICDCTTLLHVQILLRAGAYLTYPVLKYYSAKRRFDLLMDLMYARHLSLLSITQLYQSLEGTPNRWPQRKKSRIALIWRYRAGCQRAVMALLGLRKRTTSVSRDMIMLLAQAIWATRRNKRWLFINTTLDP